MIDRDPSKPKEEQGFFRKYDVTRVDGHRDGDTAEYLVLRLDNLREDQPEHAALVAYIRAAEARYPQLAADLTQFLPSERRAFCNRR